MKLKLSALIFTACLLLFCCGKKEPDNASGFALDTYVNIEVYEGRAAADLLGLIDEHEKLLSKSITDSDIARVNSADGGAVKVSAETLKLLRDCAYYYEISDGRIDPTIGSLSTLWDFKEADKVPSDEEIKEALKHVGFDKIVIEGDTVRLKDPGTRLDLGFIAKGYIAGCIADETQDALINLGGNIVVKGKKPGNKPFRIGIEKPFGGGAALLVFEVQGDVSVVTSGIDQRGFECGGRWYHHILDAKTGYPADNELLSVSILCADPETADALSTTCFVLGREEGSKLIENTEGAEALFIDKDMNITVSSGFPEYSLVQ